MRKAIAEYHRLCIAGRVSTLERVPNDQCYPLNLESLNEGVQLNNEAKKAVLLQKLPIDPMTGSMEWAYRAPDQENRSEEWNGPSIAFVYSKSNDKSLDGTKYRDW